MQNHVKVYFDHFGYGIDDRIACECCGGVAVEIHHIVPRSKFGKKMKWLQDLITNLVALCRPCHDKAHQNKITVEQLNNIVCKRKN